jgi:hypothetical protein
VFRSRIHLIRIRIQHFRLNTDADHDSIWFWWPLDKNVLLKNFFITKNYNFSILGLHRGFPR